MKHFTLPGTDLLTSTLGFGCAPIMGRQGKRESLNALACAYEAGIIHYDVARSYGFGEAEKVVGRFIRDKRDRVCLVTKFGIQPQPLNPLLRIAKPVLRAMLDAVPSMRSHVRRKSNQFLAPGNFSVNAANSSLHASLTNLDVDTIDLFLLHECNAQSVIAEDLFDFLDRCVAEGKIRYYGFATDPASAGTLLENFHGRAISTLQTPLLPIQAFAKLEQNTQVTHIVHSVAALQPLLSSALIVKGNITTSLPEVIPSALLQQSGSMPLLLRYASRKSSGGVVLVSSFNCQHIAQNARAVETPLPDDCLYALDQLLLEDTV